MADHIRTQYTDCARRQIIGINRHTPGENQKICTVFKVFLSGTHDHIQIIVTNGDPYDFRGICLHFPANDRLKFIFNLTLEPTAGTGDSKQFDISKIDFDLLRREFAKAAHKKLIIKDLADLVEERIKKMLLSNPGRMDYYDRYQSIIKEYNEEKDRAAIADAFEKLMKLTHDLTQEEKRYVREGFSSDEELSMFDKLFRADLTKQEIAQIKKVAVDLLAKVKAKIAELDHWADKPETKAIVDNLIRDTLWAELPESYDEISITDYRKEIYEYIYLRYKTAA